MSMIKTVLSKISAKITPAAVFSVVSGWSGAKSAVREVRIAALLPVGLIKWVYSFYLDAKQAAAESRILAKQDSDHVWDLMVEECGITTESVRKKYWIASLVNAFLIFSLAAFAGIAIGRAEYGFVFLLANMIYISLILMMLFHNAYRLNMAYSQSAPPVLDFFKQVIRRPMLLVSRPLPPGYKVRGEK